MLKFTMRLLEIYQCQTQKKHIKGVCLAGVTEFEVKAKELIDQNDISQLQMVSCMIETGNKRRTTESTKANATSSRSHAICQIQLAVKDKIKNTE